MQGQRESRQSSWASVQLWAARITTASISQGFLATITDNTDLASSHFTLCEKSLTLGVCVCVCRPHEGIVLLIGDYSDVSPPTLAYRYCAQIYSYTLLLKDNNHDIKLFFEAPVIGQCAQIPRVVHICKRCARLVLQQRKKNEKILQADEGAHTDLCHPTLVSCEVSQQPNTRKASLEGTTCLRCARFPPWLSSARSVCGSLTPVHHWLPRRIWQPFQADVQHETIGVNSAHSQVIGLRATSRDHSRLLLVTWRTSSW